MVKTDTRKWYKKRYIRWNICQSNWNREVAITGKNLNDRREFHQRNHTCTDMTYAKKLLCNENYVVTDLYNSIPRYNLQPLLHKKTTHTDKTQFFENNQPTGWTYTFDFDSTNIVDSCLDTMKTLLWYNGTMPHIQQSIKFSGSKGFHLQLKYTPPHDKALEANRNQAEALKTTKAPSIDLAIYTKRREIRTPYSIHHNGFVALPLTTKELINFYHHLPHSINWLIPKNVLKKYQLKNQGMKYHNPTKSQVEELENITKTTIKHRVTA